MQSPLVIRPKLIYVTYICEKKLFRDSSHGDTMLPGKFSLLRTCIESLMSHGNAVSTSNQTQTDLRNMHMPCKSLLCTLNIMYKILDSKLPGRSLKIVFKKLLVDQLIFSPMCLTAFFITLGVFQGGNFEEFKTNLQTKGLHLYYAEWVIWPPAQFINFCFLPTKFRVLYDNAISLMYDIYTSHVCYSSHVQNDENLYKDSNKENNNCINRIDISKKQIVLDNGKNLINDEWV
ncbi:unnamed protein product, partial [Meganyctiphanes norvegica]